MGLNIDTTPSAIEADIAQADATRIAADCDAATAAGDAQRMLQARADSELQRIGGDLPDDAKALWRYAEHSLVQHVVAGMDVGRALIKLKVLLPRGDFVAGLRERNIPVTTANRLMKMARRFGDRSEWLTNLGRSKLYACAELVFDSELDALESGGEVLGVTLDKMERMTAAELRQQLTKARDSLEREQAMQQQLSAEKNQRIDGLAKEVHLLKHNSLPWDVQIAPLKDEMGTISNVLDEVLGKMMVMHQAILNVDLVDDERDLARRSLVTRYAEVLDRAAVLVAECQGAFDLELGGYVGAMREYLMQLPDDGSASPQVEV